ncbi:hypothetical protein NL676_034264 [Syzygium grande]|nr:hypothetical protein NL676_034264 [Syzygium grande]
MEKHKEEHRKKQEEKSPHEVEYWEGESWEKALKKVDEIKGWELQKCKRCPKLRVVESLDELEFLTELIVNGCPSLEILLDISNSKIPDKCLIRVSRCRESLNSSPGKGTGHITFERYKRVVQQGARQPETNEEEAKMEWDAEELDELELQSSSSASFSDHEISEEPTSDNVKEGTPPGNQNQMMEQESNPLSLDELGKQNQTTGQQSNPLSLDELGKQNQTTKQDSNPLSLDELGKQNQMTEQDSNPLSFDELGKQNQRTEQDLNTLSPDELAPPKEHSVKRSRHTY